MTERSVASQRAVSLDAFKLVIGGPEAELAVICGPCVIESRDHCISEAEKIVSIAREFTS